MSNNSTQVSTIDDLVTETITLKLNVKDEDVENLENLEIEELLKLADKAVDDGNKELLGAICQELLERIKDKKLDLDNIEMSCLLNMTIYVHKAANNKELLDLCCQEVADRIKYKMPEEVREIFHIENDFTPEEEAKVQNEHPWAFKNE